MEEATTQSSAAWWNHKKALIFALIACGAVQALVISYGKSLDRGGRHFDILMGVILNMILLGWCSIDAKEKIARISGLLRFALILIPLVGVPWYFIRSRGFVGALKHGFGFGLFAIWLLSLFLGSFVIAISRLFHAH